MDDSVPQEFFQAESNLTFYTAEQLTTSAKAKSRYIHGTFKLVRKSLQQLVKINTLLPSVDHTKQVPLLFVLMAGKSMKDYK